MSAPRTPDSAAVRSSYLFANVSQMQQPPFDRATLGEAFDRWLAEVKAEAWDEAYAYFGDMLAMPHPSNNPYRVVEP